MAASAEARANFANNCVKLIQEYDFDGIDIGMFLCVILLIIYFVQTISLSSHTHTNTTISLFLLYFLDQTGNILAMSKCFVIDVQLCRLINYPIIGLLMSSLRSNTHNTLFSREHSGTANDTANFKLLLNDVRAKLNVLEAANGRRYGLTAALPCGPNHIANMDIAHTASVLSELNLMT